MTDWLIIIIASPLLVISTIVLMNAFLFPRLSAKAPLSATPFVSVMIPARDEAQVIGETVQTWLSQSYPHYEVLILDDHSSDGTGDIARQSGGDDARLCVMQGVPLPDGWMGKNWACHQMSHRAKGDILLFTDADVQWESDGLQALIADMTARRADVYSVWSTQTTITWTERLCVPLMALVILGYLPIIGVHHIPLGAFGAANGQCMAWRKDAYQKIGGHERVRGTVLEDVTLARIAKGQRMRLRMADGAGLVMCRMYRDWGEVRRGYAKNILAGYGSPLALMQGIVFHWLIFLIPPIWLIVALLTGGDALAPALFTAWGMIIRALTASISRQRVMDAVFMPISALLMTLISLQALYWHYMQGGPTWKGRIVPHKGKSHG